jgi:UDP-N-acetylmuramoylalanine--D-glutamate ligase
MYNDIIELLSNKKIAILGFGKEGQSTYHFIRRHLPDIHLTIVNNNDSFKSSCLFLENDQNLDYEVGEDYLQHLDKYDLIIKSPGISLKDIDISNIKDKLTSQLGLVLENTKANVIGITGSKGKSTTTSLIYKVLADQGYDAYLLGNIGIPLLNNIEKFTDKSILVIEMAALQLEYVRVSPHIGLVLNLFEEHLDFFGTPDKYYAAKLKMFEHQTVNDYGFYSKENETLRALVENGHYQSKLIPISFSDKESLIYCDEEYVYYNGEKIYDCHQERTLLGHHNLTNIMFVLGVAKLYNLDIKKAIESINTFTPLEHRMEKVGTYKGITFYNDAIATIPNATINCIEALGSVDTLILGGLDRGIDYEPLISYLSNSKVNNVICMPISGNRIGQELEKRSNKKIYYIEDFKEVVNKAYEVTSPGKICLLSPSAPSYNQFKNFEEKGKIYKELIKEGANK